MMFLRLGSRNLIVGRNCVPEVPDMTNWLFYFVLIFNFINIFFFNYFGVVYLVCVNIEFYDSI